MHRKPSGASSAARNWCHVCAGTVTRSCSRQRVHDVADQAPAASAQHEHRVDVAVALQRRVPARGDLEVAQFACEVVAPEQRLARHVAKRHAGIRLVREQVDAFPAEAVGAIGALRELADGTIAHRTLI